MSELARPPQPLCDGQALQEGGLAWVWDLLLFGRPARGFALRHGGAVRAWVNRCVHVPVEMDWLPGRFLDADARWIVCSMHGAHYDPADGRCVAGPCAGGRLRAIAVAEREGRVYWYPTQEIRPLFPDDCAPPESTP